MEKTLLKNCRLYNSQPNDNPTNILVAGGKIVQIAEDIKTLDANVIDAQGFIVAPGFIDIHIQGAGGSDVMDSAEALVTISKTLARFGVTGFLATTVSKPEIDNKHLERIADKVDKDLGGARILGIHIEGPFINLQKRGGISAKAIYPPSAIELEKILEKCRGTLRIMTIAPELPGNSELIQILIKNNIVASFGHSAANYSETLAGFSGGISHVTHIINAMMPIHHREPGPVTAIFESNDVTAQIISDGVHLHSAIINLIYKNLGIDRCVCITDGMQAIGLPEGKYIYNGREYESRDGVARYYDGTLIGTAVGIDEIARRFRKFTGCSFAEAIDTITINPAKVINQDEHIGKIAVGADADLVLIDQDESVFMTIIKGKIVYQKKN